MRNEGSRLVDRLPGWAWGIASVALVLGVAIAVSYLIGIHQWAGVSVLLTVALWHQYTQKERARAEAKRLRQFVWDSELRFDYYPEIARPPERHLLEWRRNRIESDPDLSAREREVDGLEN